ncbi:N-acetylmuramoyl-L-alanine amidase [Priestia aryabhattai]|uniref:peptidoglycan recognition protein family protein n=1 Tax=Priestia aryabhattai TaxID=412384 RepID=UPI002E249340|nr:N-acetylmuramoyl-L-alanine amidase [Priestia aryabhattai]MED4261957.1 N-acetylmuramoyl-L-alanine amidase [Priestia aryabhattai]
MALWIEDLVKVNHYTRRGLKLLAVKGIVVHYTATPGASAKNERDYFNGTCITQKRAASAHIFVDKNEARLIVPLDEVAFHANDHACRIPQLKATADYYKQGGANLTAIGVEMCIEKDGSLHANTLKRTIQVVAELCKMYKLQADDIFRHYDVTGKNCPAFWVKDPAGFANFKNDVAKVLKDNEPKPAPSPVQKGGIYRVRKFWGLPESQIGAFSVLESAKDLAYNNYPFKVFDDEGATVYAPHDNKPYGGKLIKVGSTGVEVKWIQQRLGLTDDGIFGTGTKTAVAKFQKTNKLAADGIVGKDTWSKLF